MKTVMIVEDDQDARELMATILRDSGFQVIECNDGLAALSRLVGQVPLPDTIVLDLAMPVMSGHELVTVLHGYLRLANVPVIIVTGTNERIETTSPMIRGYVTKPYEPAELVDLVRAVVSS